jgi:hypothetical protein
MPCSPLVLFLDCPDVLNSGEVNLVLVILMLDFLDLCLLDLDLLDLDLLFSLIFESSY